MIQVTMRGGESIEQALNRLISALDLTICMNYIAEDVIMMIKDNIAGQGSIFGSFAPLAESTRENRKMLGYSPSSPILIRSGELYNSFRIKSITSNSVTIESVADHASYHQTGTGAMPQRTLIDLDNSRLKQMVIDEVKDHILAVLRG